MTATTERTESSELRRVRVHELRRLTTIILDNERPFHSLREEVLGIKRILADSSSVFDPVVENIADGEIKTPNGVAISPTMAAMCVDDFARTVQFLRGVHETILRCSEKSSGRPVSVLYVGCGPYAALATPLMSVLTPDQAVFSLVDVNPKSIASAKSVMEFLGFCDHVDEFRVADAASLDLGPIAPPDILVIEMLRALLKAEPQVAVSRHLIGQIPEMILVPGRIEIRLELVNIGSEFSPVGVEHKRDRIAVGNVFTLDQPALASWKGNSKDSIAAAAIRVPAFDKTRYTPMLFTDILVSGDHSLTDYNSGLSIPRPLSVLGEFESGDLIQFEYVLGEMPHLRAKKAIR